MRRTTLRRKTPLTFLLQRERWDDDDEDLEGFDDFDASDFCRVVPLSEQRDEIVVVGESIVLISSITFTQKWGKSENVSSSEILSP